MIKDMTKEEILETCNGIYGIFINEELVYIGMTMETFERRWIRHKTYANNPNLQKAQQNYLYKSMRENRGKVRFEPLLIAPSHFTKRDFKVAEYTLITVHKPKFNVIGVRTEYKF